jgi:uncharacterized protein
VGGVSIDFDKIAKHAAEQFRLQDSLHGVDHWLRVESNGRLLATKTGADVTVVRLFAFLHDSQREDDFFDDEHGVRAAQYAVRLRGELFELSDEAFALLFEACRDHTTGMHHADQTIGTCWDADRLDLGRVGIVPQAQYMSTEFGRELCAAGSLGKSLADRFGNILGS